MPDRQGGRLEHKTAARPRSYSSADITKGAVRWATTRGHACTRTTRSAIRPHRGEHERWEHGRAPRCLSRLLVVAEPWASFLVDGVKTWELRTSGTAVRGPIGIAAKGTGTIIGAVDLVGAHGPLTPDELAPFEDRHRVDPGSVAAYSGPKGLYGWEMTNAQRFETPVPYLHPRGAVIWVRLDPPVVVDAST